MKILKKVILGGVLLISSFAFAQGPPAKRELIPPPSSPEFRSPREMMRPGPGHWQHLIRSLNLSPEQTGRLQELREAYLRDTLAWRNELVIKRFDLRDLLRNPRVESSRVLAKQREISELEAKIQERTVLYQLEIRKVLTPEQLKLLPPEFFSPPFHGPRMRPWRGGSGRE